MSIDHMVALTVFLAVLLMSFGVYGQILSAAVEYQRNNQVAMKAADLIDNVLLSPGCPEDWGQRSSTPVAFGLQDPKVKGYSLSPFSLQRLLSSGDKVYYDKTGMWYSNVSMSEGGSLLVPVVECVSYTTVTKLLGINGSYGFQLSVTPTLTVSVSEVNQSNPLRLKVEVRGPGLALGDATLKYFLYHVIPNPDPGIPCPLIEVLSGITQTDSTGSAFLDFSIDGSQCTYSIIAYTHLSGLVGVGYASRVTVEDDLLVPIVASFEQEKALLAHLWDVSPPSKGETAALHYNATFLLLTQDFKLRPIQLTDSSGLVNYGEGKPYGEVQIPASEAGILLVAYRRGNEDEYGTVMMPWGINALGVSITFGGDPSVGPWVATELRQVTVNQVSYQVKLAAWSVEGYQV